MLKTTEISDKLAFSKNNNSKPASSKINSSKQASGRNNGNNKIEFGSGGDKGVEYAKKLRKSKVYFLEKKPWDIRYKTHDAGFLALFKPSRFKNSLVGCKKQSEIVKWNF